MLYLFDLVTHVIKPFSITIGELSFLAFINISPVMLLRNKLFWFLPLSLSFRKKKKHSHSTLNNWKGRNKFYPCSFDLPSPLFFYGGFFLVKSKPIRQKKMRKKKDQHISHWAVGDGIVHINAQPKIRFGHPNFFWFDLMELKALKVGVGVQIIPPRRQC